jgi:phage protein D
MALGPDSIVDIGIDSLGNADATFHNDDNKKSADGNACDNCQRESSSYKETAQMTLRGYPLLKAKGCVTVSGVGKGSGKWYCHTVDHGWTVQDGYVTRVYMTKGKEEGGGGGGNNQEPDSTPPSS